jgi:hypothetical protein
MAGKSRICVRCMILQHRKSWPSYHCACWQRLLCYRYKATRHAEDGSWHHRIGRFVQRLGSFSPRLPAQDVTYVKVMYSYEHWPPSSGLNTMALTPREVRTLQERGAGLRRCFSARCWRPANHSIELRPTQGWLWKQSTQMLHHMLSVHYRLRHVSANQSFTKEDWRWISSI